LTTAALPWRTGPSLFSLWHAGGLAALGHRVAYGLPWLDARSQKRLWGEVLFSTPQQQADWTRDEAQRLGVPALPEIFFFKGVFSRTAFSIFITQDAFAAAPPSRTFLVQEPEHFGWLPFKSARNRPGVERILGIVMTNYGSYIRHPGNPVRGAFADFVEWRHKKLMRKHADVIVPLSPALDLAGVEDLVQWQQVTGVLDAFAQVPPLRDDQRGVYFLGRLTWDKGLQGVIDSAKRLNLPMDVYGDGPDQDAIRRRAGQQNAPLRFCGPSASPWEVIANYRVFFNPSISEVLCTTTAEALVAGRHVVIPNCPANQPFFDLPNVHVYDHPDQADGLLEKAIEAPTAPPDQARDRFNWEMVCQSVAKMLGLKHLEQKH
jgi:digalactosyldiacylglycerol synthase